MYISDDLQLSCGDELLGLNVGPIVNKFLTFLLSEIGFKDILVSFCLDISPLTSNETLFSVIFSQYKPRKVEPGD